MKTILKKSRKKIKKDHFLGEDAYIELNEESTKNKTRSGCNEDPEPFKFGTPSSLFQGYQGIFSNKEKDRENGEDNLQESDASEQGTEGSSALSRSVV